MDRKRARSNVMLVLTAFIWGLAFVAQSVGMDYVKPFTFNAARFFIGGVVLIPLIFWMKKPEAKQTGEKLAREKQTGEDHSGERQLGTADGNMDGAADQFDKTAQKRKMGIIGGICCGTALFVASAFQQFGVAQTSVGKAGFITALYIIIVPILGIFMKRRVALTVWISVVIATVGMYLLCMSGGGLSVSRGDLLVFICSICFSFHILVIDYFSPKADGVFLSCIQFFTAGVMAVVCALVFESPTLSSLLAAWAPVLYAGVMSCGVGYTLQVVAQKDTDPVIASLILSLESVFSLLAGWVLLGQKLNPKELFGCVLVFVAILLAQLPEEMFDREKAGKADLQE